MSCSACFCLFGQKKRGSAVHMVPDVDGHSFCTKPAVSLLSSHRGAATDRDKILQPWESHPRDRGRSCEWPTV